MALSGSATPADYQNALRTITYNNTSDNPSTLDRTISFTVNDGESTSDARLRNLTITPINDAPQGTDNSVVINEDTSYTFSGTDFGYADPIESHNFAAITVESVPASGTLALNGAPVIPGQLVSITGINSGNLIYTPLAHQHGSSADSWDFSVRDNGGTANGGLDKDQTANTISIDIIAVNDAPQGSDGTVATIEGAVTVLSVQDFGFLDPIEGDVISAVIVDAIPVNGDLLLNGVAVASGQQIPAAQINAGELNFTAPLNGGNTQSDMTFRVVDNGGNANNGSDTSAQANVLTFSITPPPNTPPASEDTTISLPEDTVYSFAQSDFIFSDPVDNHQLQSVLIVSTPESGILTLNNAAVSAGDEIDAADLINLNFTPEPSAFGPQYATFDYRVVDDGTVAGGGSNISVNPPNTVTIDVTPVNDAPTASDNTLQTVETDNIQFTTADFGFSDALDQHSFQSLTVTKLPVSGVLQLGQLAVSVGTVVPTADIANGQLTYSPAPIEVANSDQFEFIVTDNGGTANAGADTSVTANTININVTADNTRPGGQDATLTVNEDGVLPLTSDVFGYTDETDGHPMAGVIITALPADGILSVNNIPVQANDFISTDELDASTLTFTPVPDTFAANYASIDFLVVDSGSSQTNKHIAAAASTLSISVLPVNDAPESLTINGDLLIAENTEAGNIGSVVFTDADLDDEHVVTVNDDRFEVVNGVLALKSGITLDHESEDVIPLQLTVTDSAGASAVHDFLVQIADVNEAPVVNQEIEPQPGAFSFTVPVNVFIDPEGDDLQLSASLADGSPLPSWMQFDPATSAFTINEDNDASGQPVSVLLTATDPDGLSTSTVFDIRIEPPVAPALPAFIPQPTAIPEAAPEVETDETTEVTEGEEAQESSPVTEETFDTESIASAGNIDIDEQALTEVVQLATSSQSTQRFELGSDFDFKIKTHNEFQLFTNTQNFDTTTAGTQQEIAAINTLSLKNLSEQADASQADLKNAQVLSTTVLATSTTVTSSLSVGYILWLLRGGTLLASVMASLPAWRSIDPLPVLEGLTGDNEGDTETLESMVESEDEEPAKPVEKDE